MHNYVELVSKFEGAILKIAVSRSKLLKIENQLFKVVFEVKNSDIFHRYLTHFYIDSLPDKSIVSYRSRVKLYNGVNRFHEKSIFIYILAGGPNHPGAMS